MTLNINLTYSSREEEAAAAAAHAALNRPGVVVGGGHGLQRGGRGGRGGMRHSHSEGAMAQALQVGYIGICSAMQTARAVLHLRLRQGGLIASCAHAAKAVAAAVAQRNQVPQVTGVAICAALVGMSSHFTPFGVTFNSRCLHVHDVAVCRPV